LALGTVRANPPAEIDCAAVDASPMRVADPSVEAAMMAEVDRTREALDTIGGIFEVRASGVPFGLGSHVHWDRKLDGLIAQAFMSINAVKAVAIGDGIEAAALPGSEVQDIIRPANEWRGRPWERATNHAGGLEGGMTNGEDIVVRGYIKP